MKQEEWEDMKYKLAVDVIIQDLNEIFVPTCEAREKAINALKYNNKQAHNVEYRCGQVLIALEHLGYRLVKD